MQRGVAGLILWIALEVALIVAFVILQQVFYQESRRTHGLWRRPSEWWLGPSWRELGEMTSATFRKHEDESAERARRRYLVVFTLAIGWGLPGSSGGIRHRGRGEATDQLVRVSTEST